METIKFSEWDKLDLRVGKILKAENVEGADKLYKVSVDLGKEKRILIAGLKPYYKPEELKNKICIVFTNLEPRKIKGIDSQGMILAAVSEDETSVRLLQPDSNIELGSRIK